MSCCKYSVLMSIYYKENPEWLKISIDSMINQTIRADEFVIVKDGLLTKELDQVLEKYNEEYPEFFKIISLEKNIGLGPALAIGIKECRNEFIARMDSDDYSCSNRCEKQLEMFIKDPTLEIVGCYEVEFEFDIANKVSVHKVPENSAEIYEFMKKRCALLHPTVMYRKSSILNCGNYRDLRLYEDYDLFMRLIVENKAKSYNIQEELYFIRINDGFFKRRGGISYMKTALKFKWQQYRKKHIRINDFILSAGAQVIVCLLPNGIRKMIYINMLRG